MADPTKVIKGGLSAIRSASRAADQALEAKRLALEAATPQIKASEAYGQHEGAYMKPIFYDRMKVDLSEGKKGGPGFSGIQLVDPNYAQAKAAAGVTDQKMATRILNRNEAQVPKGAKVIWTPSVGGLEQHKSNSTLFSKFADIFAGQRKNMSNDEIQKLSDYASTKVDNKGKLIFPNGIDLGSNRFRQKVTTYNQRGLLADIFAGRGVGGEKGRTVPVEELLEKNLDPNVAGAGTLDLGNRLFRLDGSVIDRPDLHSDYRKILTGEDLNVNYTPVPIRDVYTDWEAQKKLELLAQGKDREVTQMDYTKNDPTVQLTEALLTKMQKAGQKKGGVVRSEESKDDMARFQKRFAMHKAIGGKVQSKPVKMASGGRASIFDAPKMAGGGRASIFDKPVHMIDGGKVAKGVMGAVGKASKMADAAMAEANLKKMLEPSAVQMRLYHGTTATEGGKGKEAIRRLKPSKEGALGSGVYLTPNTPHASSYTGIPNDEALEMMRLGGDYSKKMADQFAADRVTGRLREGQVGGNMLPVYAQIKNPLIIGKSGRNIDPAADALMGLGMDEASAIRLVEKAFEEKGNIGKQIQSRAQAQGYDGIMQYRGGDLSEVVSYNPNAIKSAIGNQGTYDLNSPDLSKAKGGRVEESPADMARFQKRFAMHKAIGGSVKKPQKFDGGGIASPEESSASDGKETYASLLTEFLAKAAKDQGKEELSSLKKPRAATDLLNRGVLANNPVSAVIDMVNMGLVPLDVLGSALTGRNIKVSSDKPFLGSEHLKDLMNEYNITSGEERPMMETALSFASPAGMIKGAQKTANLAKKAPEAVDTVRGGLETMSADVQRPFRSATLTMEGVAPDLGQKGGDKFKDLVTKRMISGEGAPVSMERIGGRKTEQTMGQGLYENFAKQLETNPMVGITIPRAGNLSTNKRLIADIGTAGQELGQEMVAAHKFTPLMFKNPKDATAMMIGGSEPLTKDQILKLSKSLPGMIVSHSPKNNSMFVAPFEGDALDYKKAAQVASEILGKGAKVQFGKADSTKDIMYRGDYDKMEARPPSAESIEMRNRLKKAEERIVRGPSVSQSQRQSPPSTLTSTVR